jgi:hypothetical protein
MYSNCINSNSIDLISLEKSLNTISIDDNLQTCSNMQLILNNSSNCINNSISTLSNVQFSSTIFEENLINSNLKYEESHTKLPKLKYYSSSCSSPSSYHSHFFITSSNVKCSYSLSSNIFESINHTIMSSNIFDDNSNIGIPIKYISIINSVHPYIPPHHPLRKNPSQQHSVSPQSSPKHKYIKDDHAYHNPHPWHYPYHHRPNHRPYPWNHYNNNPHPPRVKPTPLEMLFYRSMKRKTKTAKK